MFTSTMSNASHTPVPSGFPAMIYIIRHGEKPSTVDTRARPLLPEFAAPTLGIDSQGNPNEHSLTPRGWQRAGALAVRFAASPIYDPSHSVAPSEDGSKRTGWYRPAALFASGYTDNGIDTSTIHRAYLTVQPLAEVLDEQDRANGGDGCQINALFEVKATKAAVAAILQAGPGTVLAAWEHHAIYEGRPAGGGGPSGLVSHLPISNPQDLPEAWPDDRFDLIWCFTRVPSSATKRSDATPTHRYTFSQQPQCLLAGDLYSVAGPGN